jgi:hypothetical protein
MWSIFEPAAYIVIVAIAVTAFIVFVSNGRYQ